MRVAKGTISPVRVGSWLLQLWTLARHADWRLALVLAVAPLRLARATCLPWGGDRVLPREKQPRRRSALVVPGICKQNPSPLKKNGGRPPQRGSPRLGSGSAVAVIFPRLHGWPSASAIGFGLRLRPPASTTGFGHRPWPLATTAVSGARLPLSLVFKVSLFSLSFVIERERAPESHSAGSVCHLRRRRPWCAVKRLLQFGARCALAKDSQDSC